MFPVNGVIANSITALVYLVLFAWIFFIKKKKNFSTIIFLSWLFSLSLIAFIFIIDMSLKDPAVALFSERFMHTAMVVNAFLIFYFSLSISKDLTKADTLYMLPVIILSILIWTEMVVGIEFQVDRYIAVFNNNIWLIFVVTVFSVYLISLSILVSNFATLKKLEEKKYSKKVLLLISGISLILLIGFTQPFLRHFFKGNLGSDIVTFLFSLPAILMALSFKSG